MKFGTYEWVALSFVKELMHRKVERILFEKSDGKEKRKAQPLSLCAFKADEAISKSIFSSQKTP